MTVGPDAGRSVIAVTGASGFVGRRLVSRLVRDGSPALALSRRGTQVPGVRDAVVADYGDVSAIARTLSDVDALIHLAGRAHQDTRASNAAQQFRQANVETTLSVARACIDSGVRRFVLVSSIGVNGSRTHERPFAASDTPHPAEPYAVSKWEAERELAALLRASAVEYVVLRPPLVYGPGCPGNFAALLGFVAKAPLVPLGGLHALRSFIYVDNLVDALLVAARHPGLSGKTFLLADGRDISVGEVVRELAAVLRPSHSPVRNAPPWLLALLASVAGKRDAYEKLAAPLQVDAAEFGRATGWRAPIDPSKGLQETARQFRLA